MGIELETTEGWHLQMSRLHHSVAWLESEESAFLISRYEIVFSYRLVEVSRLYCLFHSHPLLFLLGSFIRLVRSLALTDSLFRLFDGLFWATFAFPFPFPSAACTLSSFITTTSPSARVSRLA